MSTHADAHVPREHEIQVTTGKAEKNIEHVGDIKASDATFRQDAMEAENAEFAMTVTQAAKAYPMACFWAFVMSSTIVSARLGCAYDRSWKHTVSSLWEVSSLYPHSSGNTGYLMRRGTMSWRLAGSLRCKLVDRWELSLVSSLLDRSLRESLGFLS